MKDINEEISEYLNEIILSEARFKDVKANNEWEAKSKVQEKMKFLTIKMA